MQRSYAAMWVGAVVVLAGSLVFAETGGPARRPPGAQLQREMEKLDLTADQRTKVDAILQAAKKQRGELQEQLNQGLKDLRALLRQEPPNEQAVLAQAEKIGGLRTEQHKLALRTRFKVEAELTPEQREQLKAQRHAAHKNARKAKPGAAPAPGK